MSRHLSGGSGSSHSFGGSSSGGSRSFGGSNFNGTRKVSSSRSSSSSSSSNDFDFRGENSAIIIELIIRLLIVIYEVFGIIGVLISLVIILSIYLLTIVPVVGFILIGCSIVGFILYFKLKKKKEVDPPIVDLIDNNKKYDYEIIHSEDFNMYMLDRLRLKNLLDDKGELLYDKIDQFHYEFDEIYNDYMSHRQ